MSCKMASELYNVALVKLYFFALQKLESDKLHDSGSSTNNDDGEKLAFYSAAAYNSCRFGKIYVSYINDSN